MKNTASVLVLALCFAALPFALNATTYARGYQLSTDDQLAAILRDTSARAERGDADAQFDLGRMYYEGRGVVKDDAQAVAWYRKAAAQGLADAQNSLGLMYEDGKIGAKSVEFTGNNAYSSYRLRCHEDLRKQSSALWQ